MDHSALLVAALASVPTISDLTSRVGETNSRLTNFENKMDTRFDMLLGKVVEIDNRLTRMEAQRH